MAVGRNPIRFARTKRSECGRFPSPAGLKALVVVLRPPIALLTMAPGILAAREQRWAAHADGAGDGLAHFAGIGLLAMRGEEVLGAALA